MDKIIIAIDGPAGSGKSTIAKILAKKLNITYVDTGAMYRAFTYKLLKYGISFDDNNSIIDILTNTSIEFKDNHIYLDGKIIDEEIRSNKISENVSLVARIIEVRIKLVDIQRNIAKNRSIVMDGRDICSYVLPNANYKFFITASPEERGKRRYNELKEKDRTVTFKKIIVGIKNRDELDSTREHAPLVKTSDSILIDTTNKTIESSVDEVLNYIQERR